MSNNSNIKIQFLGAAGTVTGSKYLLETNGRKILIDCGLFQGMKELRLLNWKPLPFDVSEIDCVLLTHGHLDHVGYLPLLLKQGFNNSIFATQPTIEIAEIILKDSARIQEEDAERANLYMYSKHKPAKPLYTVKDAEAVFPMFCPVNTGEWFELFNGLSFRFRYNAHIIGSVFIELNASGKLIVFSGDIGRNGDPLMRNTERPEQADILLMESTYGDRLHLNTVNETLADAVRSAILKRGTVLIPSFAVERAQLLIYYLAKLRKDKLIANMPVYFDTPMGAEVLKVFKRNIEWLDISSNEFSEMCEEIRVVQKQEETENLAADKRPKVIIAGSGMATGGRILTYMETYLGDPNSTVLLAGYQGEGTRGRALLDGAKEIKIRGKYLPVKAKVKMIEGLSSHADQAELIDWISLLAKAPNKIFLIHGEKTSAEALKTQIQKKHSFTCEIPALNQVYQFNL